MIGRYIAVFRVGKNGVETFQRKGHAALLSLCHYFSLELKTANLCRTMAHVSLSSICGNLRALEIISLADQWEPEDHLSFWVVAAFHPDDV